MPPDSPCSPTLSLRCPKCSHDGVHLFLRSETILTVTCEACQHCWAADIATLPEDVRREARRAASDQ